MALTDWTFKENGLAWHIPCNKAGTSNNNIINCDNCGVQLPELLELSAQVFGAYKYLSYSSMQERMQKYIKEKMKDIENKFFHGY